MKHSPSNTPDPIFHEAGWRLFQDSIDPIIITDLLGSIIVANEQAIQLFDRPQEELVGQNIGKLHQQAKELPDFTQLPDNSVKRFDSIIQLSAAKKVLYVEVHARRYMLNGRDIVQWIHHDITRQVELDELRQDLAAMLVHDLQSPLGNVISSLELVRGELGPDHSAILHSMVDVAVRSSHYLQTLVDSLLDISRLEAGHPLTNLAPVNIGSVVEYISGVQAPDFEQRNVTLLLEIDSDIHSILAEINILHRVLLNLLNNALKYSQAGQSIIIRAQNETGGNLVRISVIDEGQGVPEQYREIVFEKFQRADDISLSAGLGLGLAFCRLAVEAHGGRIWVENALRGGACFSFTIPAAADNDLASSLTSAS